MTLINNPPPPPLHIHTPNIAPVVFQDKAEPEFTHCAKRGITFLYSFSVMTSPSGFSHLTCDQPGKLSMEWRVLSLRALHPHIGQWETILFRAVEHWLNLEGEAVLERVE